MKNRRRVASSLFRLIGVAIFVVVLMRTDLAGVKSALADADPWLITAAVALQVAQLFTKSMRWRILLAAQGVSYPQQSAMASYFVGNTLGMVTPGRVGEIWKAWDVRRRAGARLAHALPSTVTDRALDVWVYFLAGFGLAAYVDLVPGFREVLWLLALVVLVAPVPALLPSLRGRVTEAAYRRFGRPENPEGRAPAHAEFLRSCDRLVSGYGLAAFGVTLIALVLLYVQFWCIVAALDLDVSPLWMSAVASGVKVVNSLPISVAGLGTRDAFLWGIFERAGYPAEIAVAASAILLFVNHIVMAVIGGLIMLRRPDPRQSDPPDDEQAEDPSR